MVSEREFLEFAAGILGVPEGTLSLETTYGSIPEWDSMAQLRLVTEIAAKYKVEIPFAEVVNVTSLWEFLRRINGGAVKKVVAVDLDNTLWDGVIGEDGLAGIRTKPAFERKLKELKDRGVLLVALSKNNFSDVEWFFDSNRTIEQSEQSNNQTLRGADFIASRINWECKAENLVQVAEELNLGVDSFVFVDDNPAERLEMSAKLPEVTVAAFPPNLDAYFPPREITEEDRHKTEEYRAEAERRKCLAGMRDEMREVREEVFRELGVEVEIHPLREDEVKRVAQLSQKSNQFNVCTNRRTEDEVRALAREGLIVTAHAKDKFGDQGLVAYVIVRGAEILDWVMSCRTMGRGIEERVEAEVERLIAAQGVERIAARWRDSGRNAPVKGLFERFGFTVEQNLDLEKLYSKCLAARPYPPSEASSEGGAMRGESAPYRGGGK